MYRYLSPSSRQDLGLRMLFQPAGGGTFYRAAEADGYAGLVAAILDDPGYETAPAVDRVAKRLRLANDAALVVEVTDGRRVQVGDREADDAINVASDERFVRSLHRLGFVSLEPSVAAEDDQLG